MTQKLKPCPFCGGTDFEKDVTSDGYLFTCKKCGVEVNFPSSRLTQVLGIDMWNNRVKETESKSLFDSPFDNVSYAIEREVKAIRKELVVLLIVVILTGFSLRAWIGFF